MNSFDRSKIHRNKYYNKMQQYTFTIVTQISLKNESKQHSEKLLFIQLVQHNNKTPMPALTRIMP